MKLKKKRAPKDKDDDVVAIHTDKVQMEKSKEAGPVHVGCQFWKKLKMDEILKQAGFSEKVRLLTLMASLKPMRFSLETEKTRPLSMRCLIPLRGEWVKEKEQQ